MSKNTLLSNLINYISANSSGNVVVAAPTSGLALDVNGSGRFTGALTGTSATFSGKTIISASITSDVALDVVNTNTTNGFGLSVRGGVGSTSYALNVVNAANTVDLFKVMGSGAATFSSSVTIEGNNSTIRSGNELRFNRADNAIYTRLYDGGGASGFVIDNRNGDGFNFQSAGTPQFRIAATGAATFSSSVTAGGNIGVSNGELYPRIRVTSTNVGSSAAGFELADNSGIQWAIAYDKANGGLQFFKEGSGNRMYLSNDGRLAIGATSSNWDTGIIRSIEIGTSGNFYGGFNGGSALYMGTAAYYSNGWKYAVTGSAANLLDMGSGNFIFQRAASGTAGNALTFSESMRITSSGFLKQSNTGTYQVGTLPINEFCSDQNYPILRLNNSRTSGTEEMIRMNFSGYTPNNSSSWFIYATDPNAVRFYVRSDGGIGNYQGNNVNLSDERTKKEIIPLESYWNKFKALEVVKFKYKDQTHDDFNIGVIAQQVESVAPEFVDVDGWGETPEDGVPLKSIYTADLHHATIGVLKEAMAKIETLEAEIQTLKNK